MDYTCNVLTSIGLTGVINETRILRDLLIPGLESLELSNDLSTTSLRFWDTWNAAYAVGFRASSLPDKTTIAVTGIQVILYSQLFFSKIYILVRAKKNKQWKLRYKLCVAKIWSTELMNEELCESWKKPSYMVSCKFINTVRTQNPWIKNFFF